jgi:hypothetical protein
MDKLENLMLSAFSSHQKMDFFKPGYSVMKGEKWT